MVEMNVVAEVGRACVEEYFVGVGEEFDCARLCIGSQWSSLR